MLVAMKRDKNNPGDSGKKQGNGRHLKRLGLPAPNSSVYKDMASGGGRVSINLDGRTVIAKRLRAITSAVASDLGDDLTEIQRHLVNSLAGLVVLRENLDARITDGLKVSTAVYCRLTNSTNRLASTLGLARLARDTTPTLSEYVNAKYDREDAELEPE